MPQRSWLLHVNANQLSKDFQLLWLCMCSHNWMTKFSIQTSVRKFLWHFVSCCSKRHHVDKRMEGELQVIANVWPCMGTQCFTQKSHQNHFFSKRLQQVSPCSRMSHTTICHLCERWHSRPITSTEKMIVLYKRQWVMTALVFFFHGLFGVEQN